MLLRAWKVKIEVASVFIMDYRSKGWISARIIGCFVTGRSGASRTPEISPSQYCTFLYTLIDLSRSTAISNTPTLLTWIMYYLSPSVYGLRLRRRSAAMPRHAGDHAPSPRLISIERPVLRQRFPFLLPQVPEDLLFRE